MPTNKTNLERDVSTRDSSGAHVVYDVPEGVFVLGEPSSTTSKGESVFVELQPAENDTVRLAVDAEKLQNEEQRRRIRRLLEA